MENGIFDFITWRDITIDLETFNHDLYAIFLPTFLWSCQKGMKNVGQKSSYIYYEANFCKSSLYAGNF
jgi:hypothetical protein